MNFYVLAKCVDTEKGDLIIDLDEKNIKMYKALYKLEEDMEYNLVNDYLMQSHKQMWTKLNSYQLAFGIIKDIKIKDFEFIHIGEKDEVTIDHNGFLYKNDLLLGKLVNVKEVDFFYREGPEKMTNKLQTAKVGGIRLLTKGKKIYRIFTRNKLKNLESGFQYDYNLFDYLTEGLSKRDRREYIKEIEEDIQRASNLLSNVLKKLNKIKVMEDENEY